MDKESQILVVKKIWMGATKGISGRNYGWTDEQPKEDNGCIEAGTVLTLDRLYHANGLADEIGKIGINFKINNEDGPEFTLRDIVMLARDGLIKEIE